MLLIYCHRCCCCLAERKKNRTAIDSIVPQSVCMGLILIFMLPHKIWRKKTQSIFKLYVLVNRQWRTKRERKKEAKWLFEHLHHVGNAREVSGIVIMCVACCWIYHRWKLREINAKMNTYIYVSEHKVNLDIIITEYGIKKYRDFGPIERTYPTT